MSKLTVRVVKLRLTRLLSSNDLLNSFQSAYTKHPSTESTLFSIHDHIIKAMSQQKITALCLLDLSAAFDTIDHFILVHHLSSWFAWRELFFLDFNLIYPHEISLSLLTKLYLIFIFILFTKVFPKVPFEAHFCHSLHHSALSIINFFYCFELLTKCFSPGNYHWHCLYLDVSQSSLAQSV